MLAGNSTFSFYLRRNFAHTVVFYRIKQFFFKPDKAVTSIGAILFKAEHILLKLLKPGFTQFSIICK